MKLFLDFVLVSGIIIIALIVIQLLKASSRQLSRRILIVFFLFILFVCIFSYSTLHEIPWLSRLTFIPNDMVPMVIAPLLYLYIKSLFLEEKNLVKKNLVHFVTVIIFSLFISVPTLLYSLFKLELFSYVLSEHIFIFFRLENLYLILYLILSLQLLAKYKNAAKANYSNLSPYDFKWINIMLIGALFLVSFDLLAEIFESVFEYFIWYQEYLIVSAMILLVSFLGYYGMNQSKVLLPEFVLEQSIGQRNRKVLPSGLIEVEFEPLRKRLELLFSDGQPYLDEDLTLGKLANQLSITDKKLSALLNQFMDTNFYDFVNKHRVMAVIEKMEQGTHENFNLFGIACECGFKSRTSFNRIFKKETGYSPSAYKKKLS